ncbi:MAG: hypothetical protein NW214_15070 [Pseudanabaenaceae cyanobacterium bins.39]|nr:hypothetical protein [Pseudanabaenaceae cyanobacterium bins.39]
MSAANETTKPETTKVEDKTTRSSKAKTESESSKTSTVDIASLAVKEDAEVVAVAQKGALAVTDTLQHYGDRPIVDGGFRAVEYFMSSGERPIEAGKLVVSSTYSSMGSERPIVSGGVHVTGTFFSAGERPVVEDGFQIVDKFYMAGERPVGSSGLVISDTYASMGTRPVASNAIDAAGLMGYID